MFRLFHAIQSNSKNNEKKYINISQNIYYIIKKIINYSLLFFLGKVK